MAKIVITIEDTAESKISYISECETPNEIDENGNPTLAIQAASVLVTTLLNMSGNNNFEIKK